ncbi:DUF7266 family protein [Haloarcula marina]|uniref:DUF7266 family protein n=1 Tax=Haloarcula marina TaxID=2961574 RepID=UPI0020B83FA2|nr:hypothetical protein [Halomicroarcula marina]
MSSRAVSTTLSYTLSLTIATILVSGLLIAGTGFVDGQREQVIRDELTVIGEQLAADVTRVDRLVTAADSTGSDLDVHLNQTFPERVTGSEYRVTLDSGNDRLRLRSVDPEVTVDIPLRHTTGLGDSTADGGTIQITYADPGGGYRMVIRDV